MKGFLLLVFIILAVSVSSYSQITGESPVIVGSTKTYTFNNGNLYPDGYWAITVSTRGTILSSSRSGTTYTVTVKWLTTGTATLFFRIPNDAPPPAFLNIAFRSITVNPCSPLTTPTVTGNSRFESGTLTIVGQGAPSGGTYNWYNPAGTLLATSATYTTPSISASTTNYVYVKANLDGCLSAEKWVDVTIFPKPVVTVSGNYVTLDEPVVMTATAGYDSYTWKNHTGTTVATGTSNTFSTTVAGTFNLTVTKSGATWTMPTSDEWIRVYSQLHGQNFSYIVTNSIRVQITDAAQITTLPVSSNNQVIEYRDGLGRPYQTIITQGSPQKKDIVQPVVFDDLGRQAKTYLPYVATESNGRLKTNPLGADGNYNTSPQYQFYNADGDKIVNDQYPYAITVFDNSPLSRVREQGAPGADWQPGQHTVKNVFRTNGDDEIRIWKADLNSPDFYDKETLLISETTDENGNKVIVFTDKAGRTLEKHVQADGTTWLKTLYIYDDIGRLKYIIQPNGVKELAEDETISADIINKYAFSYVYDSRQRLIEKKEPGVNPVYYCYDLLDRLTLIQDGNLRAQNRWLYIKYDINHRPVMQGFYTNTSQTSRTDVQGLLNNLPYEISDTYYEKKQNGGAHGYTNQSFPTTNTQVIAVNYYDDYDIEANGATNDLHYTTRNLGSDEGKEASAMGKLTISKKIILGTSNWLTAYMFYDKYGQVIQVLSNNHLSQSIDNLTTNVYNFDGSVKLTETLHKVGTNQVTIKQWYDYDHGGRLLKVWHSINGQAPPVLSSALFYNELGQLIDKKLHSTDGTNFLQSVDYRYNIRGWLASINNAKLTNDPITNDDGNDYFGMELVYNQTESGLNNTQYYNGNISAIKWKGVGATAGSTDQRSYKYTYDKSDRLLTATYQKNRIAEEETKWDVESNVFSEAITYDNNGNISGMQRNQRKLSGLDENNNFKPMYVGEDIDNLNYTYADGNKLTKVEDTSLNSKGFNNTETETTEYTYDNNGNVVTDLNKGISGIIYNELGKAQQITFSDGRIINYTFDAAGSKLKMTTLANSVTTTTDYVGGFVYENNALKFFGSPDGRVVKNGSAYEYQYSIADHQGNARVVFSSVALPITSPKATFEGDTEDKANEYININTSKRVTSVSGNNTSGGSKVIRLDKDYPVGPAKSLAVYPGDIIDAEVYAYFEGGSFGTSNVAASVILNMVTGVFTAGAGATESGSISTGVNNAYGTFGMASNQGSSVPAAYLNYILFDKDYKVLTMGWKPVTSASNFNRDKISFSPIPITEPGFIFVYLSYENDDNRFVEFDDFKVTHTKSNVIQYNEYYPFGMSANSSWTRENHSNNFQYNGSSELNNTTQWYEMFFRGYDPALGRMLQVDPMANMYSSHSVYNYSLNNPISNNDPSGAITFNSFGQPKSMRDNYGIETPLYGLPLGWYEDRALTMGGGEGKEMSFDEFYNKAINSSSFGGSWSNGQAYFFESDEESFAAGVEYNFKHNSWGQTYYGSYEATLVGYMAQKVSGKLLSREAVRTAIDIVKSKHMYYGQDIFASINSWKPDPTYSYGGVDGLSAFELYGLILADKTMEQLGIKDIAALVGVIAGQPLLSKRFVTPGSTSGTSPLSKFLSNKLGTSPIALPTLTNRGLRYTTSIGKFASRGIPILGWGLLTYDATMILYNTQIEYNKITGE